MVSPWVQRNLDYAQYAQHRGSQYEGPNPVRDMQDESIHREELLASRELARHRAHADGQLVNDCHHCLEQVA